MTEQKQDDLDLSGLNKLFNSASRIKFGPGVVSKVSTMFIVGIVCLTCLAFKVPPDALPLLWFVIAAIIVVVFFAPCLIFWFAAKNPGIASLGGTDLITYQREFHPIETKAGIMPYPPENIPVIELPRQDVVALTTSEKEALTPVEKTEAPQL